MNILGGISAGFKMIFGVGDKGSDNVMKVASGIGNFIDEQEFTEQEDVMNTAQVIIPSMQKFMETTVAENTERSKTRRDLALWVIRNWIIMLWVSIVAYGFELHIGATLHEFSKFVFQLATLETMIYLVLGVGGFFFGAHIVRQTKYANQGS